MPPPGPGRAPVVLGLDIGGSKTHGLVQGPDGKARHAFAGSANVSSVGREPAAAALDDLAGQVAAADIRAVCAGAAGADTPDGRRRLEELLAARFPLARVQVVHDTELVLPAGGLDHGAVVVSGTGSVGWALDRDGRQARAGGWGYLLGDEGGGYALTRDAVRAALHEADRGEPPCALTRRLLHDCGLDDAWQLLDAFYERPERRYWARLAAAVLDVADQGEPAAVSIVDTAAAALAELAVAVTNRLSVRCPVVLAGGLLVHQPLLAAGVAARLSPLGLVDVRVLHRDPVHGAVDLARRLLPS